MNGIGLGSLPPWLRDRLEPLFSGPSVADQMAQESARFRADVRAGGSGLPQAYSPAAEQAFGLAGNFDFTGPIGLGVPMMGTLKATLADGIEAIKDRHPEAKLAAIADDSGVTLSKVVVPKEQRNQGIGTAIMRGLAVLADEHGVPIALSPSADFGGSKSRLERWYRSLGFRPNKGGKADYRFAESMIRDPQPRR